MYWLPSVGACGQKIFAAAKSCHSKLGCQVSQVDLCNGHKIVALEFYNDALYKSVSYLLTCLHTACVSVECSDVYMTLLVEPVTKVHLVDSY